MSWLLPLSPAENPNYLKTTLACLRRQTWQAEELVIAADGSLSQALEDVIRSSGLPYLVYPNPMNRGIGAVFADVAPACRGEVIVRIDSDDLYAPIHTQSVVEALLADPSLGVIGSQLMEVNTENPAQSSARKTPTTVQEAHRWLAWRNPLNHQTVAMRKSALLAAGGYRHAPAFEDWDLWLRMAASGYQLRSIPIVTAAARVNRRHRLRRRGIAYVFKEIAFFRLQVRERRLDPGITCLACASRIPWRVLPEVVLGWWMQSRLRGSPAVDVAWIADALSDTARQ